MMARAWLFQDNVNTDQIIPGRYYPRENVNELGQYCLCELRPDFAKEKQPEDIIVAGKNFGCGSSREYAALALIHSNVKCVIAKSFARIFYRNCINTGFPIIMCENIEVNDGDDLTVENGIIKNNSTGKEFRAEPLSGFAMKIVEAGGLINFVKQNEP